MVALLEPSLNNHLKEKCLPKYQLRSLKNIHYSFPHALFLSSRKNHLQIILLGHIYHSVTPINNN